MDIPTAEFARERSCRSSLDTVVEQVADLVRWSSDVRRRSCVIDYDDAASECWPELEKILLSLGYRVTREDDEVRIEW